MANYFGKWLAIKQLWSENGQWPAVIFKSGIGVNLAQPFDHDTRSSLLVTVCVCKDNNYYIIIMFQG